MHIFAELADNGPSGCSAVVRICSRKQAGYRVSAGEVEDALVEIDGIVEAAVKGVDDETTGEAIKAYVVLRTGEQISIESTLGRLRERLPGYKMPRYVEVRDHLPKNESGKIMKNEL